MKSNTDKISEFAGKLRSRKSVLDIMKQSINTMSSNDNELAPINYESYKIWLPRQELLRLMKEREAIMQEEVNKLESDAEILARIIGANV